MANEPRDLAFKRESLIAMADPLPHPSKDTPQKPDPNSPPASPYLPGKGPGSKDDKLASGGPALPGEPGRPGTPKAPGGRPHLPGEKPTPAPAGRNPQLPGMKLAKVDYSGIPNDRDLKIKDAVEKYGKNKDGEYIDPAMLIKSLPRA